MLTLSNRVAIRAAADLLDSYAVEDTTPHRTELCEQTIKALRAILDKDRSNKNAEA